MFSLKVIVLSLLIVMSVGALYVYFFKEPKNITLIEAVRHRRIETVARLIQEGADLEQRDYSGATPLMIATASDQNLIAELLLEAGADPFAYDSLYITAAGGIYMSMLLPGYPEGDARLRNIERLKRAGVPLPPPTPTELRELVETGGWPAKSTPPPLPLVE